jgi:hypothetical protein
VWSKVVQTATADTNSVHSFDVTNGIRPWESVQTEVSGAGAVFEIDTVDLSYADVSNGTWGVAWAYIQPATFVTWLSNYDPYLIVAGNDWVDIGGGTPQTMPSGTVYFDHIVQVVIPHAGPWEDVESSLFGLMEGLSLSQGAAEAP